MGDVGAVVFDFYATLAAPSEDDWWPYLPQLVAEAGGTLDGDAFDVWSTGHPLDHREHSTDEATYRAWQSRLFEAFLRGCAVPDGALPALLERTEGTRYTRRYDVYPEVPSLLAELRQRDLVLGVCSNWDWDLHRHLDRNGIADAFDFVVCSASAGYRKPHPAIFDLVVAASGLPAEQILFVGDTWQDDIAGATAAGLRPVHVNRSAGCDEPDHAAVPCVTTLTEVHELLSA